MPTLGLCFYTTIILIVRDSRVYIYEEKACRFHHKASDERFNLVDETTKRFLLRRCSSLDSVRLSCMPAKANRCQHPWRQFYLLHRVQLFFLKLLGPHLLFAPFLIMPYISPSFILPLLPFILLPLAGSVYLSHGFRADSAVSRGSLANYVIPSAQMLSFSKWHPQL
jgi:hypothetical protein